MELAVQIASFALQLVKLGYHLFCHWSLTMLLEIATLSATITVITTVVTIMAAVRLITNLKWACCHEVAAEQYA